MYYRNGARKNRKRQAAALLNSIDKYKLSLLLLLRACTRAGNKNPIVTPLLNSAWIEFSFKRFSLSLSLGESLPRLLPSPSRLCSRARAIYILYKLKRERELKFVIKLWSRECWLHRAQSDLQLVVYIWTEYNIYINTAVKSVNFVV